MTPFKSVDDILATIPESLPPEGIPSTPAPTPEVDSNPVDSILSTIGEPETVEPADQTSLHDAYADRPVQNPDEAARVLNAADQLDENPAVIQEHLPEAEAALAEPTQKFAEIEESHPRTAEFLRDPGNMAVSHDNLDELIDRDKLVKGHFDAVEMVEKGKRSLAAGWTVSVQQARRKELRKAKIWNQLLYDKLYTKNDAEIEETNKAMAEASKGIEGFSVNPLFNLAQIGGTMALMTAKASERATQGLVMGAAIGTAVPVVGQTGIGTVAGGLAGMGIGARVGSVEDMVWLEADGASDQIDQIKDKSGKPLNVSPRLSSGMALAAGAINAGFEYASFRMFLRTLPGGEKLLGKFADAEKTKKLFAGLSGRGLSKAVVTRLVVAAFTESLTEGVQEFAPALVEDLAKAEAAGKGVGQKISDTARLMLDPALRFDIMGKIARGEKPVEQPESGQDVTYNTFADYLTRSAQAGFAAFQGMFLMGIPGSAVRMVNMARESRETVQTPGETPRLLAEDAEKSKQIERRPEAYRKHMETLTAGTGIENTYLSVTGLEAMAEAKKLDPAVVAEKLGVGLLYQEAKSSGQDTLKIPTADYQTKAYQYGKEVGVSLLSELHRDVKYAPNDFTMNELMAEHLLNNKNTSEEAAEVLKAHPELEEEKKVVYDTFYKWFKEAKQDEQLSKDNATLVANMAVVFKSRTLTEMTLPGIAKFIISRVRSVQEINKTDEDYLKQYAYDTLNAAKQLEAEGTAPEQVQKITGWSKAAGRWNYKEAYADITNKILALREQYTDPRMSLRLHDAVNRMLSGLGKQSGLAKGSAEFEKWLRDNVYQADEEMLYQSAPQTSSPEFKAWFGDSKVVDAEGKPLVVYHGTREGFSSFQESESPRHATSAFGFFFAGSPAGADFFNGGMGKDVSYAEDGRTLPVHLSINNPFVMKWSEFSKWIRRGEADDVGTIDDINEFKGRLIDEGFDGIHILPSKSKAKTAFNEWSYDNWVAFDPKQIKSATGNVGTFDSKNPNILEQSAQGAFDPETQEIFLALKSANAATFIHEMGHAWLRSTHEYVKAGKVTEEYARDWKVLAKWLGVKDDQTDLTREQQEKFAYHFESYLRTAKAPTEELQAPFRRFRTWLTQIYHSLTDIGGGVVKVEELSPEVRAVMGRIFASEDEVATAEKTIDYERVLERAGIAQGDIDELTRLKAEAHEEAVEELTKRQMDEISDDRKAKKERRRRELFTQNLDAGVNEPVYAAQADIKKTLQEDALAMAQKYVKGQLEGGIENVGNKAILEVIANRHGYASADAMMGDIAGAVGLEQMAQESADRQVEGEFPDLKDGDIRGAAMEAVHNDKQLEVLALEQEIVERKTADLQERTLDAPASAFIKAKLARVRAAEILAARKVKDVRSAVPFFTAERMAAVAYAKFMAAKNFFMASDAKRKQLQNHALALGAIRQKEQVEKYLARLDRVAKKRMELFRDEETMGQVGMILERFGLATPKDYNPAMKTLTLQDYAKAMTAKYAVDGEGDSPIADFPDFIANETVRMDYSELTVGQLEELRDTVNNLLHIAASVDDLYTTKDKEAVNTRVAKLMLAAQKNVNKKTPSKAGSVKGLGETFDEWIRSAKYNLESIDTFVSRLDGWFDTGIWRETFVTAKDQAADYESRRMYAAALAYKALWKGYTDEEKRSYYKDKLTIPEFGIVPDDGFTKQQLICMALNLGNETNKAKLTNNMPVAFKPQGFKWDQENAAQVETVVMQVLERELSTKDWNLVNGIWGHINHFWPDIATLHREMTGFEPKKVEAVPFLVSPKDGPMMKLDGGYFPLVGDTRYADKFTDPGIAELPLYNELNPSWKAATKTGHTKNRTNAQYSIALNLGVVNRHVADVIHDLAFRKFVYDARRIVSHSDFKALQEVIGSEGLAWIKQWVSAVAASDKASEYSKNWMARLVRILNNRLGSAVILGRVSVIAQNLANVLLVKNAVAGFGQGRAISALFRRGVFGYWKDCCVNGEKAKELRAWVHERSSYMRDRREVPEFTLRDLKGEGLIDRRTLTDFTVGLLAGSDDLTNIPMWVEAYNLKFGETSNEQESVDYADLLIRRISPSARKYDVAQVLRGGDVEKLFTKFYSFFSVEYQNWTRELGRVAKPEIKNTPMFLGFVASRLVFIYLSSVLAGQMFSSDEDDDDEFSAKMIKLLLSYFAGMIPFARDAMPMIIDGALGLPNYGYRPAVFASIFEEAGKLTKRTKKALTALAEDGELDLQDTMESMLVVGLMVSGKPTQFAAWFGNVLDWFGGMEPRVEDLYRRRPLRERD